MGKCFTGCGHTVMTRGTVIDDTCMIENGRAESTASDMTNTAVIRRRHVRRTGLGILAGRIDAIVTGVAPQYCNLGTAVINKGIEETCRVMAGRTVAAGIVMNGRIRLAPGTDRNMVRAAVMARDTVSRDAGMTEDRRQERGHRMAAVAVLFRRYMTRRFDQVGPVREELTDMAALTATGDIYMYRTQERSRRKRGC